jgi:hypothetical protein
MEALMDKAFRVSVGLLIASGAGLLTGVAYFMYQIHEADANPPGSSDPTAWIVMVVSIIVGVLATGAAMFTDLRRSSASQR